MNRVEAIEKINVLVRGIKVEGTIAAVLPSDAMTDRYAVKTDTGIVETRVDRFGSLPFPVGTPYLKPRLNRGDVFSERTKRVKPWVDGQVL